MDMWQEKKKDIKGEPQMLSLSNQKDGVAVYRERVRVKQVWGGKIRSSAWEV